MAYLKSVGLSKAVENGSRSSALSCSPGHCCAGVDVASSPVRCGTGFWYLLSLALALGCVPAVYLPAHLHLPILPALQLHSSPGGWTGGPQTQQHPVETATCEPLDSCPQQTCSLQSDPNVAGCMKYLKNCINNSGPADVYYILAGRYRQSNIAKRADLKHGHVVWKLRFNGLSLFTDRMSTWTWFLRTVPHHSAAVVLDDAPCPWLFFYFFVYFCY